MPMVRPTYWFLHHALFTYLMCLFISAEKDNAVSKQAAFLGPCTSVFKYYKRHKGSFPDKARVNGSCF